MIFCTKEEGHPLETSIDDRCFFSSAATDGHGKFTPVAQYALLTEGGVNHTPDTE